MYYIFLVNDRTSNYINIIPIYNIIYLLYAYERLSIFFKYSYTKGTWNLAIVSSSTLYRYKTTTTYVIHSIQAYEWINNTKIIKDTNYKLQFTYIYRTYFVKIINIFANIFPLTKQVNKST